MKVVIAYSHVDALAALRLLVWIKFLGGDIPLMLVASRRASRGRTHRRIVAFAAEHFGVAPLVAPDEDERGWPHSATHLFTRSLALCAGEDMLWVEPDCVPITPDWFEKLRAEYYSAGEVFLGATVPAQEQTPMHMTGNAVYGKDWKSVAPHLGEHPYGKIGAWDVDQAPWTLKAYHPTTLIQHNWIRPFTGVHLTAGNVLPGTVLYHQCKTGDLMRSLRPDFWKCALTDGVLHTIEGNTMPKFYLTKNTARPVKAQGKTFVFEPAEYFDPSSSWWGTLATEDVTDITALDALVDSGRITEISEEEFQRYEVKKKQPRRSGNIVNLHNWKSPSSGRISGLPAQVVEEPARVKPTESVDDMLAPSTPTKTPPVSASKRASKK